MSDRSGKYSSPVRIIRLQQEREQNHYIFTTPTIGLLWGKIILSVTTPGFEIKAASL
jgi:hypothetical protein